MRRASYWRCEGPEGSRKKRRQGVSSITAGPGARRGSVRQLTGASLLLRVTRARGSSQGRNAGLGLRGRKTWAAEARGRPPRRGTGLRPEDDGQGRRQGENPS